MGKVARVSVFVAIVLIPVGLLSAAFAKARKEADRTQCINNLRQICLMMHQYQATKHHFPPGTVPNRDLPPDRRLSWAVEILPWMEHGVEYQCDRAQAWDVAANCPPRGRRVHGVDDRGNHILGEQPVGEVKSYFCPADPARNGPDLPCPLHYVGMAGVGESAATLPASDPRAGFFGYDRTITEADVKDGLFTTIAVIEADGGPFTAGGPATVRALTLDPSAPGEGSAFVSRHRIGGYPWSQPNCFNAGFADGSARTYSGLATPAVLEALVTINGGEPIGGEYCW